MAPHAEEAVSIDYYTRPAEVTKPVTRRVSSTQQSATELVKPRPRLSDRYEPGRVEPLSDEDDVYDHLRPYFPDVHWEALKETPYEDKGLLGDPRFRDLLDAADEVFDYVPKIGTEITGIKLSQLTDAQKNDLARLIATRGVVFFRNQDDFDVEAQRELGRYFGTLHRHATTSMLQKAGLEDVHVIYTTDQSLDQRALFTPTYLWHSDVTYEVQPPSYTSLKVLNGPPRGGGSDTLWCSQYAIYDILSRPMQKYLESLTALHSADEQAAGSRAAGRPVRRDPVTTEHPLIRVNPVTGWKSVFFNPGFVTKIVGVPKAESDAIIRYLTELIATTQEAHVRFQWGKHDVAIWDNRCTNHTATYGFLPHRRHAVRVTPTAEKPYFSREGRSQEEEYNKKWDLPQTNKNGARRSNYND
ncbi:putative alpha-ketoglutarate-dependent sulfonate dioxygenase [Cladophialophora carrionii]|uniref:Putative alpha-ketoglutarate-dependent sulfonate dioxygenase n=1 Tax=Cladophialophora carrionii TaxID=86049 RepID=A0A1C1C7I5_9EURO|nr:putative alpha-ketoglutarate-dependent sulfonate dioxygenase [Cladophialophora carrionii]